MSDVKTLIRIKANNLNTPEYAEMLKEFKAEDVKLEGVISVPKDNYLVTAEGHLVILLPDRIDFAIGLEPDEFTILTEQ